MGQIWLEVKQESRISVESCFVLATSREVLSKYGEFRHFPQNIVTCTFFLTKKIPSNPSHWIFWGFRSEKFHEIKIKF